MSALRPLTALALLALAALPAAAAVHSLQAIEAAVHAHVTEALDGAADLEFSVGRLDPRLRLPACAAPLATRFAHGRAPTAANAVEVRCEGERPWSLYVPVSVTRYAAVVVAARALPRGTTLGPEDLAVERRRLARGRAGHASDPATLTGRVTTRAIPAGELVRPSAVRAARLVRRGERVVLAAGGDTVRIRMGGRALEDGAAGERISVRNLSSDRVVEGVVAEAGLVVVNTGLRRP